MTKNSSGKSTFAAPFRSLPGAAPKLEIDRRSDGTLLLRHPDALKTDDEHLVSMFRRWSEVVPDRPMLGKRGPDGDWILLTYKEARTQADAIAQSLLDHGLKRGDGVLILSPNSLEHAAFTLGAMTIGVMVGPISPAYSLVSADYAKLRSVFEIVKPKAIFVQSASDYAGALRALDLRGVLVVAVEGVCPGVELSAFSDLIRVRPGAAVEEAYAGVDHATVARIMFTSGSTGWPKGVIITHGMTRTTLAQDSMSWRPFHAGAYIRLSWLPWNHVAGTGLLNFSIRDGGTLFIDEGKPVAGQFETTIRNVRELQPAVYIDVPAGFAFLVDAMERDSTLRDAFFKNLVYILYSGASMPETLRDRIYELSIAALGERVPFVSGYGATEAAPGVTALTWPCDEIGNVGLPYAGLVVKLLPLPDGRMEIRVKGPNVFPGYLNQPELTAAVFDEEGFYKLGDAVRFIDESDPLRGLRFAGRVTEDFKLMTGTFVAATELHSEVLGALMPAARELLLLGHDRPYIAILVWPDYKTCRGLLANQGEGLSNAEVVAAPEVRQAIADKLRAYNAVNRSSSRRVARMLLMDVPPSVDANEITDKGYVNQRIGRERRKDLVERVYSDDPDDAVMAF